MSHDMHDHRTDGVDGGLCIDFTNTVSGRTGGSGRDRLTSYADLVAWSTAAGTVDAETAARLLEQANAQDAEADAVLRRAVALREAVYRILLAQSEGVPAGERDLALLNEELAKALAHLRLQAGQHGFTWIWEANTDALDQPLWSIVRSAANLLTEGELDRVRQCANDQCGWLFIDRSKNRSRRWCDMKDCGNLAKVRRYRRRHKQQEAE